VTNIADASADGTTSPTDTETADATQSPALGLTKNSPTSSITSVGEVVDYYYVVTNTGNTTLTNVTLVDNNTDNVPVCVPAQPASLPPGAILNCTAKHIVTLVEFNAGGNLSNIATTDSDQTGPVQVTLDIPIVNLFDPPFGIKDYDESGLPLLRWTMVWINDSNTEALDAEVYDPIPAGTTYVLGSVNCTVDGSISTTTLCMFDGSQIVWEGTIGPDPGATNAVEADNEIVITFLVTIPEGLNSSTNDATLDADLNDDGVIDEDDGEVAVADAQAVWVRSSLPPVPETGFEPGVNTTIPVQTQEKQHHYFGDVWLEIPALGVRTSIVGVPIVEENWDVTWLSNSAGWLEGTAFPSYSGNSVVTAHVYLPSGLPGPVVNLNQLAWDDQIIVHAFGQKYIFMVRSNKIILPDDPTAMRHEEYPWLTLLTCRGFNDYTDSYNYRVMIRAVLIDVRSEYIH
jgi:LPXTG-site transpeptidase (sortase) family protein